MKPNAIHRAVSVFFCRPDVMTLNARTLCVLRKKDVIAYKDIPGPRSLPFLKSAWTFLPFIGGYDLNKIHKVLDTLLDTYGPVVRIDVPLMPLVWLFDPEDFRTVLNAEGKYPQSPLLLPLKVYRESQSKLHYFGGITTVNGQEWYDIRSKIQRHLLHIPTVESYIPKMNEIADVFIEYIKYCNETSGNVENIINVFQTWAIENIIYVALNVKLNTLKPGYKTDPNAIKMKNAAVDVFSALGKTVIGVQLWRVFPTKAWRMLVKAHDDFTEACLHYIHKILNEGKESDNENDMTLLETLIKLKGMKPEHAVVMMMDLLLAGTDTTSNAATFLFYNISRYPDVQDKLYKEVESVLKSCDEIPAEKLHEMKYLQACIKETLRYQPIISAIGRVLDQEVIVSNYRIPPGTNILMATMSVMKQEKYYPKADEFLPERWLDSTKRSPYNFMPFGHKVRSCVGRRMALQELQLLTAKVIKQFRIECNTKDLDMVTGITSRPDQPLTFQFIPRN